ncbi:DMT family transporter [Pseudomonas shirazensis]|uniref:DMT family transporter n=1 Tax=Pseudomonas shirazensis TaxID=2745494 RepID=UPI001644EAC9|nr:DMT family transporter [Pseudomonas shirazensis]MBV4499887.1 DMT family transporter [Pseudomonas shirazensis]
MGADRLLLKGLFYGVCAGLCWGVIFLGPQLTLELSGLQFAVLRFLCYGVISAVLLGPRWKRVCAKLTLADWKSLFWLSLIGNLIYYTLVGTGVQLVGIATTSLIVGLIPVLITLAGRHDENAVALHKLVPSLCCCVGGVTLISWHAITYGDRTDILTNIAGILCAAGALVTWSWFAVSNARRLVEVASVSSNDWALLTGVMTGAQSLFLALPVLGWQTGSHDSAEWVDFLLVAGGVAFLSSVVGGACWNQASRLLPLALSGQVLVIETLAALLIGFLWEHRLPDPYEIAAMALLVTGVVWCLNCHRTQHHGDSRVIPL